MSSMKSKMAKKAGLKLFEKHLEQYTPKDPLYEEYIDDKGKKCRRKREIPPGLSKRDAAVLKCVKKRAHHLDKGFHICGIRFGWTFLISLIPVVGDVTDAALNYLLVVRKARQAELPTWLVRRMLFNNAFSAAVGAIPIVGDIILGVWKANSRNAALLEEFLRVRGEEFLKIEVARDEDPKVVKPGAGREPGEKVEGKTSGTIKSAAEYVGTSSSSKLKKKEGSSKDAAKA
ncbi:hypothetical protein FRC19_005187 [Serendipita sp. 401]|nr:hypothetical protein FRC15_006281 [Serendipita sp. 397]KAG8809496.1 hypothetical protein FRC19_005187 [Serendipita sp. 401]KAG8869238.1 hypothetical protein FRC20_001913 [Serendipita sp. 405]